MTTHPSFGLSQTNASLTDIDDCVRLLRMLQEKGLLGDHTINGLPIPDELGNGAKKRPGTHCECPDLP